MPSIEDVPQFFADYWGINLISAQTILSLVVILAVLLPIIITTRGKQPLLVIIMFFLTSVVLVSVDWLDSWVVIMELVFGSFGIAILGRNTVMGS